MKKALICVDLKDESVNLLKEKIDPRSLEKFDEIILVHGFELMVYADNFHFMTYPQENNYEEIKSTVKESLDEMIKKNFDYDLREKMTSRCLISRSPKATLSDFAKEEDIDVMFIGTRGKHGLEGLFSSSFAEYMVRHAPCELRILRDS